MEQVQKFPENHVSRQCTNKQLYSRVRERIHPCQNCWLRVFRDTLIAFRLLEATVLNETDEKFVLTGVDYEEAKQQKNLYDQVKASLKKFQGRNVVGEDKSALRFDPALVASVAEALAASGWKKQGGRRRSNTDPGPAGDEDLSLRNSNNYKICSRVPKER